MKRGSLRTTAAPRKRLGYLIPATVVPIAAVFPKGPEVVHIVPESFACVLVERIVLYVRCRIFDGLIETIFIEMAPIISVLEFGKVWMAFSNLVLSR